MWNALLLPLAALGYDAIAVDLPGHGESDPLPGTPSIDAYADTVAGVADELRLDSYHLVGHHTGVAVALALAARHRDRVEKIVGWGVPLGDEEFKERLATEPAPTYDADGVEILARWRRIWEYAVEPSSRSSVVVRTMAETLMTAERRAEAHNALGHADIEGLIRGLSVPMLMLAGTREILWQATIQAAELSRLATYRELGDHGFFVVDEATEEFADAIDEFLRS
jgi:pimeloyl-ACP methyl ester carboxylesterase